jgi:hypothetical protein
MSTFQIFGNLVEEGALIDLQIFKTHDDFLLYYKKKDLTSIYCTAKAMIDTGAARTSISNEFISKLALTGPEKTAKTEGFGGTMLDKKQYDCVIYNPIFKHKAISLTVLDNDFKHCPYNAIIGRDLLVDFTFIYDGWSNSFRLININV